MQQRDRACPQRDRLRLEQQHDRRDRAGRSADHDDLRVALGREQIDDPLRSADGEGLVGLHQPVAHFLHQRDAPDALCGEPVDRLVATGGDQHGAGKLVKLMAVGAAAHPARPQTAVGAGGVEHFMPGQHRTAILRDERMEPLPRRADERSCFDQGHAKRPDIMADRAAGGMIGQRRQFGMGIVLHRAQEGLGGGVGGNGITPDPPFAERIIAFGDNQARRGEFGQSPALARGGEHCGAGRPPAHDQQRCDRVGARAGGDARFGGEDAVEGDGDHRDVGNAHRIGDRQRQRPPGHGIGDRCRQDRRGAAEQRLVAQMRAEIAA